MRRTDEDVEGCWVEVVERAVQLKGYATLLTV